MIPALLWTAAGIIFAVEVAVICRVWSDGDAIRADEVALTLPYAEAREDLTEPESWPVRQTPTDLQAAYEDVPPPWPWRSLPLEYGLRDRFDRYEVMGVNRIRSIAEIVGGTITEQFDRIVVANYGTDGWKCDSCAVGRDGEDQHVSCPGCACHCGDNQGAQVVHIGEPGRNAWMETAV